MLTLTFLSSGCISWWTVSSSSSGPGCNQTSFSSRTSWLSAFWWFFSVFTAQRRFVGGGEKSNVQKAETGSTRLFCSGHVTRNHAPFSPLTFTFRVFPNYFLFNRVFVSRCVYVTYIYIKSQYGNRKKYIYETFC